ncbi:stomatin-like protein 1 isoform X4 [Carcharodon carcharias]|uniref:stomatin-like protein 1 isoform X4 n=1 Tax=Carcharodon carcharias TaxID=13397 RepID=UPI001B7DB55C|nr:stomatin-like protein 1 isoform X4 [Carcharodon carcharias]
MRMSYQPVPSTEENLRAGHQRKERSWGPVRKDLRTDSTQGCPELICSWILIVLTSLLMILTFPITGWFVLKATCKDGAVIIIGAEVHYHIWNPVLSVAVVEDIDSTTVFTAQNMMIHFLLKRTLAKIQADKNKSGEQLAIEINKKTRHWGLEVQRVDLILHRVMKQPQKIPKEPVETPPSTRLNKLPAPLRKLAAQIKRSRSPPQLEKPSSQSSEIGDSVQASPEESGSEEFESDIVNPDWILSKVKAFLTEDLVKQIGACYLFTVNQKDGTQNLYYLDLSRDSGMAGYGMPEGDPDVALEVTEDTMQALFLGDLKPFSAYMSGRIRIQGDLKLAMKLEDLIKKLNR